MIARAGGEGVFFGGVLEGLGIPVGGMRGDIAAVQTGKGLVGLSAGECRAVPPTPMCSGRI